MEPLEPISMVPLFSNMEPLICKEKKKKYIYIYIYTHTHKEEEDNKEKKAQIQVFVDKAKIWLVSLELLELI